jgi:tRNA(Ile)-lysidine synthase TilS/MesJ
VLPSANVCSQLKGNAQRLCVQHKRVVLSVSGGVDSMCLLHVMAIHDHGKCDCHAAQSIDKAAVRPSMVVATIDHGLRRESKAECLFVLKYAQRLGLDAQQFDLHLNAHGKSSKLLQTARVQRYMTLAHAAQTCKATAVLTAHHRGVPQLHLHWSACKRFAWPWFQCARAHAFDAYR